MFDDFKLDNEYSEEKKKYFGLTKLQIIMIALIIFAILFIIIANSITKKDKDIRIDKANELVYTTYTNERYNQEIPYINIKGEDIIKANEDISSYTKPFKDNKYSTISYEYQNGGGFDNLLSLLITMKYEKDNTFRIYYASYNIDTINKVRVSNKGMLKAFGLTQDDVDSIVEEEFEKHYQDELKKTIIDKETCDFDCYLDLRNISNIKDNEYSYYVDNTGKLLLYLPFIEDSIYNEQEYFSDEDHIFELKDKPVQDKS